MSLSPFDGAHGALEDLSFSLATSSASCSALRGRVDRVLETLCARQLRLQARRAPYEVISILGPASRAPRLPRKHMTKERTDSNK